MTDFTRRMWISAAVAVPLVVLTMGPLVGLPIRDWVGHRSAMYLEFLLATPIILWAALPFFKRGWDSIINRSPNMWTLISLSVLAAYPTLPFSQTRKQPHGPITIVFFLLHFHSQRRATGMLPTGKPTSGGGSKEGKSGNCNCVPGGDE